MSVSRTPIRNARRAEEEADARKTAQIIAALCAFCALAYVGGIIMLVHR